MRDNVIDFVDKPLQMMQTLLHKARKGLFHLKDSSSSIELVNYQPAPSDNSKPNDANNWEQVYLAKSLVPVKNVEDELALRLLELTSEGDILLEAGCGFGKVSAQLGLANRKVAISDFSENILKQAEELFRISKIQLHGSYLFDMTKTFPLQDGAVDTVWSSGVLEHWTGVEQLPIVKEMVRISHRSVISFVPYQGCLFYRMGKYLLEKENKWIYGREIPMSSQRKLFEEAGLKNIQESLVLQSWAPNLLHDILPEQYCLIRDWWNSLPENDIVKQNQGYLLATIGYKS